MYHSFIYVSAALAIILIPFLIIPLKFKSPVLRQLRNILSVFLLCSIIITFTPEKAVNGAPINKFGPSKIAYLGCSYQIMRQASFCEPDPLDNSGGSCYCKNANARATIAHCYSTSHDSQISSFLQLCQDSYNITITKQMFEDSLNEYNKYAKPLNDDYNRLHDIFDAPLKIDDHQTSLYKQAYDQFLGNYDRSVDYGFYLLCYWLCIFALAAIGNWSKIIFPKLVKKLTDPLTNWYRANITLPATYGKRKTNEKPLAKILDMLVPTRLETFSIIGFFLLTCFFVKHNIGYVHGDPIFLSQEQALLRYYAVRTSILSSEIIPLFILFGGRNNILQWITRWDYSCFIALHRWVSRIIFGLVVIHAACYSFYMHPYSVKIQQTYLYYGVAATFAGGFIMIQGLLVLRRKWYEAFLIIHIVLAFIFIAGAYAHVADLYCMWFYYYTLAIWLLDRIIRLYRLMSFGFPKAKVILLADESLKIIVPKPDHWEAIPGGHAFIHFLLPSCFWQSHPFTYTVSVNPKESNIILFVKVKDGVTKRLHKYLCKHPGRTTEIRVAIEGSYGEETPAFRSDSAVFVAGGNGIPGIYAEVYDYAKHSPNNSKQQLKLVWVIREYKSLYWFYEELYSLKNTKIQTTVYVTKPELKSCLEDFHLRFPITSNDHEFSDEDDDNDSDDSNHALLDDHEQDAGFNKPLLSNATQLQDYNSTSENSFGLTNAKDLVAKVVSQIKKELAHIDFKEGRPQMEQLVRLHIKESLGSAAFVTCGHPVMVDDLRAAVVNNLDNDEKKRVDYYEQLQVWA
ncbi:hypothetical protein HYPBUDRAFT_152383 [Hyphopichia burtonii NRRL Y-1933]|uniref:FAD-binding FR-type domain-containing protein n=1 Tax=Hyphopichia burtonii NRRL Y-1933 TaxID=984485 RepID=A0A1E4RJI9_9ASCO|nr:hypothetical protein HYPBUDRAFT_152383 [Hyphopichia burtonii NRRL Y-1933]ODV67442.1 hypothetical protein HYPBUDRAFT_152383 [Hyphopichia burtonii NRRL Y-1933]